MELFKYLSEERVRIFSDGLIRFTQPQAFNDPFELKPSIESISTDHHLAEALNQNFEALIEEQYSNLPLEVRKVLSRKAFSLYAESKKEEVLNGVKNMATQASPLLEQVIHEGFEKHVGVLSLTESPSNLLMWAHYANSHEGFVIGFDSSHPFFDQRKSEKDELRHLKKVIYETLRPRHVLSEMENMADFLVKSTVWAYEEEWRMLVALADADKQIPETPYDICLFQVPFNAFTSVRVGARASEKTKNTIESLLQQNPELSHVECYSMAINKEHFELDATKII